MTMMAIQSKGIMYLINPDHIVWAQETATGGCFIRMSDDASFQLDMDLETLYKTSSDR